MAIGDMTLTAVGNLTADPELRFTASGLPVVEFTIAVNARERDPGGNGYRDVDPSFVRVQAWRQLAENIAETLQRGHRVIVSGRWRQEHWEKDGEKRNGWKLMADSVGAELAFATARITKTARRQDAPPGDPWASGSPQRPPAAQAGGGAPPPPDAPPPDDPPF